MLLKYLSRRERSRSVTLTTAFVRQFNLTYSMSGPDLSPEQQSVFDSVLRDLRHRQEMKIGGFAGVGKTRLLAALARRLYRFAPCAFTGVASRRE
jgi:hypothetical protein